MPDVLKGAALFGTGYLITWVVIAVWGLRVALFVVLAEIVLIAIATLVLWQIGWLH